MLSNNYTEKLLGLKEVIVKNIEEIGNRIEISIELPVKAHVCPCCGTKTKYIHNYRSQAVKDILAFGKQVTLILRKRRYRCHSCGKCFYESNSFLPRYHRVTSRLVAYVVDKYHWIRQVIWSFEAVRKQAQKKFSKIYRIYFKRSKSLLTKRFMYLTDERKQQVNAMIYASSTLSTAHI